MSQQSLPFKPARPNLLIEAGAGTGKTTAIVREVLHLLLEHPELNPERLVMITFTEKAAAEIGERIRDAITELHVILNEASEANGVKDLRHARDICAGMPEILRGACPERAKRVEWAQDDKRHRQACARHLEHLDKIRSQTIHAFCQSILRMFPIEARVDPNFRLIDGYERSRLLQEAYGAWLERETLTHPTEECLEDWETVLEHFTGVDRVQSSVFELLEKRVLVEDDSYPLGDFADAEETIRDAIAQVRELSSGLIESASDDNGRKVLRHLHTAAAPSGQSIAEWHDYFSPIAEALEKVNLPSVPKAAREALKLLRRDGNTPSVFKLLERHEAAVALRRLARRFLAHLDGEKQKRGVLDFDDLLLRTAMLLDHPAAAEAVRARYDYIFVDEFQDTDRVQARIIDRLARNKADEFVHGRIVLVGDPKQSIYAFRHADPETYRDTLDRFEAGGAQRRTLARQYRSEPALVGSLNAIFTGLFSTESEPNVFRPRYHELEPARKPSGAVGPHITLLRAEAKEQDKETGAAEHEGRAIAWYVREQVSRGRSYRDFAILLRKMGNVQAFLDGFDRFGIPYVLPPTGALLETRPVVDLLAVLRSIAAPFDLGGRVSAARTPYFALDDDQIVAGVLDRQSPAWAELRARLDRYGELSARLSVAELIDLLIEECQIEPVYGVKRNGAEWLRFLERFREMAMQFDLSVGGSLAQFVDELLRRRDGPEEPQPTPIDDGRNAVKIMTVHGAKGLEFPVVILPELCAKTKDDTLAVFAIEQPRRLVFSGEVATLASRYLRVEGRGPLARRTALRVYRDRKNAEIDRLFYVAVTRAQEDVVFVCSPQRLTNSSFWKRIAVVLGWEKGLPDAWSSGLEIASVGDRRVPLAFVSPQTLEEEALPSRFVEPAIEARLAEPPAEADEPLHDVVAVIPRYEVHQRVAASKNRAAGILLHRTLELWNGEPASIDRLLDELAREQGADGRAVETTRQRIATLLRSDTFRRITESTTHGRELTIYYTDEEGSAVEARMDRLIEEDGRLIVVDFKSGKAYDARTAKDRNQVERYCAALGRMTSRSCQGMLWYIDIDSDEVVELS